MQAWPMLRNLALNAPSTAASRSASGKTRNGAFPPSSMEVRRTPGAERASRSRPTGVEPVKDSLRTRGSSRIAVLTGPDAVVGRTLTTPAGTPTSRSTWANKEVVSGVREAGFTTTVHPAASAGAILRVAMASGKFHGVIR